MSIISPARTPSPTPRPANAPVTFDHTLLPAQCFGFASTSSQQRYWNWDPDSGEAPPTPEFVPSTPKLEGYPTLRSVFLPPISSMNHASDYPTPPNDYVSDYQGEAGVDTAVDGADMQEDWGDEDADWDPDPEYDDNRSQNSDTRAQMSEDELGDEDAEGEEDMEIDDDDAEGEVEKAGEEYIRVIAGTEIGKERH